MIRTLLRDESNHFRVVDDPDAISDLIQHKGLLLWIDLEKPTQEEMYMLRDEFHFHPLAIEDATIRHQRPKVDQYTDFYLVVFYSVEVETGNRTPSRCAGMDRCPGCSTHRAAHNRAGSRSGRFTNCQRYLS